MYLADDSSTLLGMGGSDYALKKLLRWKAEGPTERNKQLARYITDHGRLNPSWSQAPPQAASLLIDLALEWNDLAMWQEVIKKSVSGGDTSRLSSDVLIRAWSLFSFDRTKNTSVYSIIASIPHPFAYVSHR